MKHLNRILTGRIKIALSFMSAFIVCLLMATTPLRSWGANKLVIKMGGSFAFLGLVATMKKNKKWDSLDDDQKAFIEAQDEATKSLIDKAELDAKLKEFVASADLKNQLTDEQMLQLKEMNDGYKAIAQELQKIKDRGISNGNGQNPIMAALKEGVDLKSKATFSDFVAKKVRSAELEVKSIANEGAADVATHTIGLRVPGIGQIPVRKPFLMDLFPTVPTTLEYVKYMDQESIVRDAQNVYGTNTISSTTKVTWKERNIQIMKIRDLISISVDMLADYDFVMGEINQLLSDSVLLKADEQLLNGTGANPEFHSIDEYAGEFDATNTLGGAITALAGTIQAPNVFDLCSAMAAQISAIGKNNSYQPNTILMNSFDTFQKTLVKDKNNNYILPPFVTRTNDDEYVIHGMIVRSNPIVPANSLYVFDRYKGKIYIRKGFVLEMAYNNSTDFEIDQVTMKGVIRMNFFVRNVDINAFMVCSDINTALLALASA